jgi:hypothetical protein
LCVVYGWISVNQHLEVSMSNNKQSSIEWYASKVEDYLKETYGVAVTDMNLLAEAKAMHKEEITKAFDFGDYNIDLPDGTWEQKYKSPEQYYNETFGS